MAVEQSGNVRGITHQMIGVLKAHVSPTVRYMAERSSFQRFQFSTFIVSDELFLEWWSLVLPVTVTLILDHY